MQNKYGSGNKEFKQINLSDTNVLGEDDFQFYSNTRVILILNCKALSSSLSEFAEQLAPSVDIVFPVIHDRFSEDGGFQELLEKYNVPFVGIGSRECQQAFDKYIASLELSKQGFVIVPSFLVQVFFLVKLLDNYCYYS
ncbi:Dala_Dala_lig_N domain-containing protein [Cephalotus follicularis]|uniref:Dala_Dala_lig_N domain-containing protein n=1 Tax=Cephalotus follicularis TaxID=3775 RepID=A0A1Q3CQN5_CEPFO|nr:Dala_Dala_lig_N domain-containing protein [Cephalotus follicularis]